MCVCVSVLICACVCTLLDIDSALSCCFGVAPAAAATTAGAEQGIRVARRLMSQRRRLMHNRTCVRKTDAPRIKEMACVVVPTSLGGGAGAGSALAPTPPPSLSPSAPSPPAVGQACALDVFAGFVKAGYEPVGLCISDQQEDVEAAMQVMTSTRADTSQQHQQQQQQQQLRSLDVSRSIRVQNEFGPAAASASRTKGCDAVFCFAIQRMNGVTCQATLLPPRVQKLVGARVQVTQTAQDAARQCSQLFAHLDNLGIFSLSSPN